MLTELRIENFAIVSKLELTFAQGMTAFTGETGAGKSIMIDALMLALGDRADASSVRHGTEKCDITASFQIAPYSSPAQWLLEHDIPCDDCEVYLRRVLYAEGRSKSYINGHAFPQQKVKEFSELLVDIHGQHQHQRLLHHTTHREQLDQYANHQPLLDAVQDLYRECNRIKTHLEQLRDEENIQQELEALTLQIEELETLAIQNGELEELHQEHQRLSHARDYLETVQRITALFESDEPHDIRHSLTQIAQLLMELPQQNAHINNACELLQSTMIQCDETLNEVELFARQVRLDPERLQVVDDRMSELHRVARKYQTDPHQLTQYLQSLYDKQANIQHSTKARIEYQRQYQEQYNAYQSAAMQLRLSRQQYAAKLSEEITNSIRQLGMPQGYVEIEFNPLEKMQSHGLDKVEYKVCTNPGTEPESLAKIASGGELSRISLAIHVITAERGTTPTLLFDEVDVGIGGVTAALVGKLLRNLGQRLQVFCVTHQPQVACSAHHHFRVEKQTYQGSTFSQVFRLESEKQVEEIARMLSGFNITEQTRINARELLMDSQVNP